MKEFFTELKYLIFVFTVYYILGALIAWDMNIGNWSETGRVIYVIWSLMVFSSVMKNRNEKLD